MNVLSLCIRPLRRMHVRGCQADPGGTTVDAYHACVRAKISPYITGPCRSECKVPSTPVVARCVGEMTVSLFAISRAVRLGNSFL